MQLKRVVLAGFRGHAPRWFEHHGKLIDIVAVAGPLSDRVRGKMAEGGCRPRQYDVPAAMLEREEADIALIWTPRTEDHVPLGMKALERGMHVLLEKPLSEEREEAYRFVRAARDAGRLAMVMQDIRWQTAALEVKEALEQGHIGELYWLDVRLRGRHGSFIYEGIHLVDLARFWVGDGGPVTGDGGPARDAVPAVSALPSPVPGLPPTVLATAASPVHHPITRDNVVSLTIGFEDGRAAKVTMDWSSQAFHHWIQARLQGDRGAMTVTWGEPIWVQHGGEEPYALPKWREDIPSMRRLLAHFIECIDAGREPINSAADHCGSLEIVWAAWESAARREVRPAGTHEA